MATFLKFLERLSVQIAGGCVAAVMLIVTVDAGSRYLLNAPLPWAYDLVAYYLLIAILYLAVSSTFHSGDHMSIDLFRGLMSKRFKMSVDVIWSLLSAAVFAAIAYAAWEEMAEAYTSKRFMPGYFSWPTWASFPPIIIGSLTLALRLLHHGFRLVAGDVDPSVDKISGGHVE